jgi:hypothetical protein
MKPKKGDELKVKGIDVIKSSFPVAMQKLLEDIIINILNDVEKEIINEKLEKFNLGKNKIDIEDIAINTGIKELVKYEDDTIRYKKGTPAHIKAAINYNYLLKKNNYDTDYELIKEGDKIKYVYLKKNEMNMTELAFISDLVPKKIKKFIEENIDRDRIIKSVLENKVRKFYDVLDWNLPDITQNVNKSYF